MKTKRKFLKVLALTLVFAAAFVLNFAAMPVYAATGITFTGTSSGTYVIGTPYTVGGSLTGVVSPFGGDLTLDVSLPAATSNTTQTVSAGTTAFPTYTGNFDSLGNFHYEAEYEGDGVANDSTGDGVYFRVIAATPTLSVSVSPSPPMQFSDNPAVSPADDITVTVIFANGYYPTGTLSLVRGATTYVTQTVTGNNTYTLTFIPTAGTFPNYSVRYTSGDVNNNSITAATAPTFSYTAKYPGVKAAPPKVQSRTTTSITLAPVSVFGQDVCYSIDGGSFGLSSAFDGLTGGTLYDFRAQAQGSSTYLEGPPSEPYAIRTRLPGVKVTPPKSVGTGQTSMTVGSKLILPDPLDDGYNDPHSVQSIMYGISEGPKPTAEAPIRWQTGQKFSNLTEDQTYYFWARSVANRECYDGEHQLYMDGPIVGPTPLTPHLSIPPPLVGDNAVPFIIAGLASVVSLGGVVALVVLAAKRKKEQEPEEEPAE